MWFCTAAKGELGKGVFKEQGQYELSCCAVLIYPVECWAARTWAATHTNHAEGTPGLCITED